MLPRGRFFVADNDNGNVREPSLSQLLRRLGLEKYTEVFHKNEIDMQLFLTMTDKELKEVGNNFGRSHVNLDLEDLVTDCVEKGHPETQRSHCQNIFSVSLQNLI